MSPAPYFLTVTEATSSLGAPLSKQQHVLKVHLRGGDQVTLHPCVPPSRMEGGGGDGEQTVLPPHHPVPTSGGGDGSDAEEETWEWLQMVWFLLADVQQLWKCKFPLRWNSWLLSPGSLQLYSSFSSASSHPFGFWSFITTPTYRKARRYQLSCVAVVKRLKLDESMNSCLFSVFIWTQLMTSKVSLILGLTLPPTPQAPERL